MRRGKLAASLQSDGAAKFLTVAAQASDDARQQLMARWTGNYKHGNERRGKVSETAVRFEQAPKGEDA